jgi:hypothetical protein
MAHKFRLFPLLLFIAVVLNSCSGTANRNLNIDVSKTNISPVNIKRYEKQLFAIDKNSFKADLKKIAPEFPVFLKADLDDTLNLIRLHDFIESPLNIKLYDSVQILFPNLSGYENQLTDAFKRYKFYFPEIGLPNVFSYVSGLSYEYPVQFYAGDMIVALDMYLGNGFTEYRRMGLPLYKIERMNKDFLVRDCINEMYFYTYLEKPGKNVLQKMIGEGKRLYFLDAMLPGTPDNIKIGYPEQKLNWCQENESKIWAFMIENDLIFSSDMLVIRKFFTDGPYSHSFSSESPARLGEWLGWQIVKAYMNKNQEVTLQQLLLEEDDQKILTNSRYKPKK